MQKMNPAARDKTYRLCGNGHFQERFIIRIPALIKDRDMLGQLLETFVFQELSDKRAGKKHRFSSIIFGIRTELRWILYWINLEK
jgi:hypothetical protein